MKITSKTWKAAAKKWWWAYQIKNAEFYDKCREATHNQIFAVNMREKSNEARRWARKLYADNARLRDQNEFLTGLIKSVEWKREILLEDEFCPWCDTSQLVGHSPDCPAFNPDGTVK